jgi:3'-5' exonuclease
MINETSIESILFLDIETVSAYRTYEDIPEKSQKFWEKKSNSIKKAEEETAKNLYEKAGIYSEFGKIICISVAFVSKNKLRIKSFYNDNEKILLSDFANLLNQFFSKPYSRLCAHNGKEFDFPYICRRMLIHKITIPTILHVMGKKPWETSFLDTMEMWKFGDYKSYTSLDLLADLFNINSPKEDIDGSMVNHIYWEEHDLERIKTYCQKDVLTVVQLFLCYQAKEIFNLEDIIYVE